MTKPWLRRNVLLAIVALATAAALVGAIYAGIRWDLSRSDWAAWVQAVGSIGAILVALAIVQVQHARELTRQSEARRTELRGKLTALRWLLNVSADTCNSIATKVGQEHVAWHLQAEVLRDRRSVLAAIPVTSYPDPALLIRVLDLTHRLQMAEAVVAALSTPRRESTQDNVAAMLRATRDEALIGVTEATTLLAKISTHDELKADWELLDMRDENRELALKAWAEIDDSKNEKPVVDRDT